MWHNKAYCSHLVSDSNKNFDYFIELREDAYFFHSIELNKLFAKLDSYECGIVVKNCLEWNGINMRISIMKASDGISYVSSRLDYYSYLLWKKEGVFNPEVFEQNHLLSRGISICRLPVEEVPVTAARPLGDDGDFCCKWPEVQDGCVPKTSQPFTKICQY
jgi:hypothetical protein